MCGLVKNSGYEILTKYSGKKSNNFKISNKIDNLIDTYITNAQTKTNFDILKEFRTLQYQILNDKSIETINLRHDIDLLFKDKNNKIYYLEIKYNIFLYFNLFNNNKIIWIINLSLHIYLVSYVLYHFYNV